MEQKIIRILHGIDADINYATETSLFDKGLIDSLAVVEIVVALEDKFDIEIDAEDIIGENFNSVATIKALVEKSQNN